MKRTLTRTVDWDLVGEQVFVYRNLHRDCWSVRSKKTGLVIAHVQGLTLHDAKFKVSEAGRQRVLREQKKNVHAGIEGRLQRHQSYLSPASEVTYNPYRAGTFYCRFGERPVTEASEVEFKGRWVRAQSVS
jgi:hypothetical protein